MKKDTRPPILIREQFRSMFAKLTDAEKGKILSALMDYQWDEVLPTKLPDKLSGVFLVLQSFIDDDVRKYKETSDENRRKALLRWQQSQGK